MTDPQTEQTRTPEPESGNLFRVLETHAPDSATAHAAVEEVKNMAGHNVVAQLGARIDTAVAELGGRIDKVNDRIDKVNGRIDNLQGEMKLRIRSVEKRLGVLTTALIVVLGAATAAVIASWLRG